MYEITFLGQAGTTLRAEFDDCEVIIGPGTTTLRAELPDRGALTGLMERISSLGLDVIDVSLVAVAALAIAGPGRGFTRVWVTRPAAAARHAGGQVFRRF